MILSGGGKNLTVTGKNLNISASGTFERKDLSGGGSSTSFASEGNKPKSVSVTVLYPFNKESELFELRGLAEALEDGEAVVYTVTDRVCKVMGIRSVIFDGNFRVSENSVLRAWDVSFELKEFNSAAEAAEEREVKSEAEASGDGDMLTTLDPEKINEAIP